MDFEFFIRTPSDTGLALHDIKFEGDSILYELRLQETYVTYASDNPKHGGRDFLDSGFLMRLNMVELVPGHDCPPYATFLWANHNVQDQTVTRRNGICIFEYTADHALQRHTSTDQVSIGRNTYMVVRWVSTVGNYDYTFDYVFTSTEQEKLKFEQVVSSSASCGTKTALKTNMVIECMMRPQQACTTMFLTSKRTLTSQALPTE